MITYILIAGIVLTNIVVAVLLGELSPAATDTAKNTATNTATQIGPLSSPFL